MNTFGYEYNKITGLSQPTLYPGEKSDKWELPEVLKGDVSKLNSIIESKYSREYLKVCAFYNKMFPSLKTHDWTRSTYNTQPFTALDQERADTGNGTSTNYLKQIIDQVVSRLGTIQFQAKLLSDEPTLEYIVYKDEVERILKKVLRNDAVNRLNTEVFHDAAILNYSYALIDPYTGKIMKVSDYEIGIYESQLNKGEIKQLLYRDFAFPVVNVAKYLVDQSEDLQKKVLETLGTRASCDFKLYFDCIKHEVYPVIQNIALAPRDYPYDTVLVVPFMWDVGFTKVTCSSLFDLLYPIQREINRINAKIQQLIRLYKGAVPVFNSDVDLAMKAISNGAGEALYVDSSRPIDTLMTVINPTPLDPALEAEIQSRKTEMMELAGLQSMSFDMENMRSAASVIALDQTRDSVFQAQLQGLAQFDKDVLKMYVRFMAKIENFQSDGPSYTDWEAVSNLLETAQVDLQPVHLNDPLGNEDSQPDNMGPDYIQLLTSRMTLDIMKGKVTFATVPYFLDIHQIEVILAVYMVKLAAMGIAVPDTMHRFLLEAFIDSVKKGEVPMNLTEVSSNYITEPLTEEVISEEVQK